MIMQLQDATNIAPALGMNKWLKLVSHIPSAAAAAHLEAPSVAFPVGVHSARLGGVALVAGGPACPVDVAAPRAGPVVSCKHACTDAVVQASVGADCRSVLRHRWLVSIHNAHQAYNTLSTHTAVQPLALHAPAAALGLGMEVWLICPALYQSDSSHGAAQARRAWQADLGVLGGRPAHGPCPCHLHRCQIGPLHPPRHLPLRPQAWRPHIGGICACSPCKHQMELLLSICASCKESCRTMASATAQLRHACCLIGWQRVGAAFRRAEHFPAAAIPSTAC